MSEETRRVADYAVRLRYEDLPPEVLERAKNAIADFDAALKINPRLTSSLYGRGLAKQRNGAMSEGELDISNAKAMDPDIVKEFASYGVH